MKYKSQGKQLSFNLFESSLFMTIRKRIGINDFNDMSESLLKLQGEFLEKKEKEERRKMVTTATTIIIWEFLQKEQKRIQVKVLLTLQV